jgi:DNA mismatch endonuclease (patch repair protein)
VIELHPDLVALLARGRLMSRIRSSGNRTTEARACEIIEELDIFGSEYFLHWPPARPADLCFPAQRLAVLLNGCFWHAHPGCYSPPSKDREAWTRHINTNRLRDLSDLVSLRRRGWEVVVLWECEMNKEAVCRKLTLFAGLV